MSKLERLREIERRYISLTSGCDWPSCQCHSQLANVRKEIELIEVEAQVVRGREVEKCTEVRI